MTSYRVCVCGREIHICIWCLCVFTSIWRDRLRKITRTVYFPVTQSVPWNGSGTQRPQMNFKKYIASLWQRKDLVWLKAWHTNRKIAKDKIHALQIKCVFSLLEIWHFPLCHIDTNRLSRLHIGAFGQIQ